MPFSAKTKSLIATSMVLNQDDLYPDRSATTGEIREDTGEGLFRLDFETVPRTTTDMSRLYKWKKGTKLYGTHATKEEIGMNSYIKDILSAPNEADYEHNQIYIDTFKPIGPQLEQYKK